MKRLPRPVRILLHPTAFLCLAAAAVVASGRWLPLLEEIQDPAAGLAGIALGIAIYYGTVSLFRSRLAGIVAYLREVAAALRDRRPPARRLLVLAARSVYEEVFWRGTLQVLLGGGALAVAATSALFTLRHVYLHREAPRASRRAVAELLTFSLVLGGLYWASGEIALVISVHFVRNLLISARCGTAPPTVRVGRPAPFRAALARPQQEH